MNKLREGKMVFFGGIFEQIFYVDFYKKIF